MSPEPRIREDYTDRQVEAARRVLVDVGQVLASFREVIVLIGGWVPDLLLPDGEPKHTGSIDLDLALDAEKLTDGRYAELLHLLLATGRYQLGDKSFQFYTEVNLGDDGPPIRVEVEFLAPAELRLRGRSRVEGFRVLQAPACAAAFTQPREVEIAGRMVQGAKNTVSWRVAELPDFLIMKAWAMEGRDKPKDAYDFCYCLDQWSGVEAARALHERLAGATGALVEKTITILREQFASAEHYGPWQYADFQGLDEADEHAIARQRAYQLVAQLLTEFARLQTLAEG